MNRVVKVLVSFSGLLAAGAAQADCYDVFGCTDRNLFRARDLASGPNCDFLFTMRNSIYKQHGYCFRTRRAIETFGNEGCTVSDVRAVPLNRFERANAATILRVEQGKRCPAG